MLITSRNDQLLQGNGYSLPLLTKDADVRFCEYCLINMCTQLVGLALSLQSISWTGKWRTSELLEQTKKYLPETPKLFVVVSVLALKKSIRRIDIYNVLSETMLNAYYERHATGISQKVLVYLLTELAAHMTQYLATNTIEEFNIRGKYRCALEIKPHRIETPRMVDDIVQLLADNIGLLSAVGKGSQCLYRFRYSLFQGYVQMSCTIFDQWR
ncbi:unnamed protein product [Didymodactylos carnosus]|uniref:Uncharacterized protein n=1 Tax=Didymodactylos carnosus TaxID=1234261 RepID=A0A815RI31_9BILA|nr:unnamed protein product [Didymodactylos carnosus]CAF1475390.1 unnamed protein product [Didymodactylos carnosus]CAF4015253.1 unnamed protein product [Didymodactylos carnosus]CAF4341618.1 unnamed protein product [Didymodactylos carnosus]